MRIKENAIVNNQKAATAPSVQQTTVYPPVNNSDDPENQYIVHNLNTHDTLVSLALTYNTTQELIMKANGLICKDLDFFGGKVLHIPKTLDVLPYKYDEQSEQEMRRNMIHAFCTILKEKSDIAQYYLDSNDFVLEKAIQEYKADIAWEQQNKHKLHTQDQISKLRKRSYNLPSATPFETETLL